MRRHALVFHDTGRSDIDRFWPIAKHEIIVELSKQPEIWRNATETAVFPGELP